MNLGPTELIILLVIVLVLFGGAKLPKLAKSLGEAQREFKKGTDDDVISTSTSTTVVSPTETTSTTVVAPADPEHKNLS